jgi:uncharacterized membrane protein
MSRVVLVGESWFTYSVHQKGFDAFYTSGYGTLFDRLVRWVAREDLG